MSKLNSLAQTKTLGVTRLPEGTRKRAAVIFANQDYQLDQYDLRKTYNDADDMKAALERLGFKVIVFQKDLGRVNLDREIRALATKLKGYEVALVYYSGHGGIYEDQNYFIPTDVPLIEENADIETHGVSLNKVYKALSDASVKTSIVISDACRNLAIGKGGIVNGMTLPVNNPAGTFTMFATRYGKAAKENLQGRNSYFTQELLRHIEIPNLTLNQIFKATRQSLQTATAQFKEPQVPGSVDELDNEFVFIQTTPSSVYPAPPSVKPSIAETPPIINHTTTLSVGRGTKEITIVAQKGQTIKVVASGVITVGSWVGSVTPTGTNVVKNLPFPTAVNREMYNIEPKFQHGSLLYRLASTDPWGLCGDYCSFEAPQSGRQTIQFVINDNNHSDNSGKFDLKLSVQ